MSPRPLGRGGYARIYSARVKSTGETVALKRLLTREPEDLGRMSREIRVQSDLQPNEHTMPVWDSGPDDSWYVMPLAQGDAVALRADHLGSEDEIATLVKHVAAGLKPAYEKGLVHRDITPRNLLALETSPYVRWVVADWGLVRRPLGQTSNRFTKSGVQIGTEGFIAPEVLRSPHEGASISSDIFSIGRVVGWAVSGQWPLAGERFAPAGRFRRFVRLTTTTNPDQRPDLEGVLELLDEAFDEPADVISTAADLVTKAQAGDARASQRMWSLALDHIEDGDLLVDHFRRLPPADLRALVSRLPEEAAELLGAMRAFMMEEGDWQWGKRQFQSLDSAISWFFYVAQAAEVGDDLGLLEDAAAALFEVEVKWQQFDPRHTTRRWFGTLKGQAAETVARALRVVAGAKDWYMDEEWQPPHGTAAPIRAALRT